MRDVNSKTKRDWLDLAEKEIKRDPATLEWHTAEGITVAQDEIVPANFRTLAAIRAFVQRKKDA